MYSQGLIHKQISRIARRNVLRNWRHSLSTILAIAAGFASIALLDGFMAFLDHYLDDSARYRAMRADLVIQQYGAGTKGHQDPWSHAISKKEQDFLAEFLAQDRDVTKFMRSLNIYGVATAGGQSAVFAGSGYDLAAGGAIRGQKWYWNAVAGVPIEQAREPSLMVAAGLGQIIGCVPTQKGGMASYLLPDGNFVAAERPFKCSNEKVSLSVTTEAGQANMANLPVAGIGEASVRELNKRQLGMDLVTAQQALDTDKISEVFVLLQDRNNADEFAQRLKEASATAGYRFEVIKTFNHPITEQLIKALSLQRTIRNIFMVVVFFIVIMAVTNTMMKAVKERTREIGTLRSIGFLQRHIVAMFAAEGLYLSLMACMVGFAGAMLGKQAITVSQIKFNAGVMTSPISIRILDLPYTWAATALLLVILATTTALVASRRAAHMVVADAMRDI